MERVSTVGYYAIKQSLIGFITERGESRCNVYAVIMPNCSAVSAALVNPHQAGEAYVTLASAVDWNTACRAGGGMPWLRRVRMQSIQNTCTASNNNRSG